MIKPHGDYVVGKPITERHTQAGLIVQQADNALNHNCKECIVVAVGPGMTNTQNPEPIVGGTPVKAAFEPGDMIIYSEYSGAEYEHQGEVYVMLMRREVIATVTTESANIQTVKVS